MEKKGPPSGEKSFCVVMDELIKKSELSDFVKASADNCMCSMFSASRPGTSYTIFAPTNKAMAKAKGNIKDIIKFHIGRKAYTHDILKKIASDEENKGVYYIKSLLSSEKGIKSLGVESDKGSVVVNDGTNKVKLPTNPIRTKNGIIYIIDQVLTPGKAHIFERKEQTPTQMRVKARKTKKKSNKRASRKKTSRKNSKKKINGSHVKTTTLGSRKKKHHLLKKKIY
jgi:hypothetical protein